MTGRLVLVLGDQLTEEIAALQEADRETDTVVMAEVADETSYVPHHNKKIAFLFAAMRKFAKRLRASGWTVRYTKLEDPGNSNSIRGELLRRATETGFSEVYATQPGEWRLIQLLEELPLEVHQFPDTRFFCSVQDFGLWAEGRKQLRMENFYRHMRRKTGILMDGREPVGGKWNFDHDNRKPAPDDVEYSGPMQFAPDNTVHEVLDLAEARFKGSFGTLSPFWFATDSSQARRALAHFIERSLPKFGDYQDAMLKDDKFLNHSVLSIYINAGLLDPHEVCSAAEAAYWSGKAPINSVEGFIRQILGWREYLRGIYYLEGPEYTRQNILRHDRDLPDFFWTADTDMACIKKTVEQTRDEAYAHHIQRLMVTGNFALLAGIDPFQVHEWYLAVYADAYEWVEAPNVIGMSQFADGGVVGSKPYVSSGAYIDRMSNYCASCTYSVKTKSGLGACPFNPLYWHFLNRHRDRFERNPRMANMYRTFDRMDAERRDAALASAEDILARLNAGDRI